MRKKLPNDIYKVFSGAYVLLVGVDPINIGIDFEKDIL